MPTFKDLRFKAIICWLIEAWLLWTTIIVLLVALLEIYLYQGSEPVFRISGLFLQLSGLYVTVISLYKTHVQFEQPSFSQRSIAWWRRAPWKKQSVIISGASFTTLSPPISSGLVTTSAPRHGSAEERFMFLEKRVQHLTEQLFAEQQATAERFKGIAKELVDERHARGVIQHDIGQHIENIQTGGLGEAAMGLVWVLIGGYLSTGSVELSYRYKALMVALSGTS